jgi:hypothetical protein
MNLLKLIGATFSSKEKENWSQQAAKAMVEFQSKPKNAYFGQEYSIIETTWDGEKTQGELGAPLSYVPDYTGLSYRSWKAFTDSDLAQIIIKAHVNWVIGSGLKLQAEPKEDIIESEGFTFDKQSFISTTESRYRIYVKTNSSMHSQMMNHNKAQRVAYLNAIVGGDVLCILRVEKGLPTLQLIDGVHVQTPDMDKVIEAENRGNKLIHGVEYNKAGTHQRFYVRGDNGEFQTVEAFGEKTGRETAFILYGSEYRIDSVRGLPLLSAVLEKISKLDRYNEAIVGGTEEAAKVPWFFEHKDYSTGENPDLSKLTNAIRGSEDAVDAANSIDMDKYITAMKRTYEKEAYNLPVGATMKKLESSMEKDQEAFTTGNFIYICAALEIPYEVALMKYVNSFSSSRMASQSFLFILNIKRTLFNDAFNKKYYNLFLDVQILAGKIKANGYFTALNRNDVILTESYRNARFTGPGVPQADPFKEVKAEVEKINNYLTTRERSMEILDGNNDFLTTIDKLAEEKNLIQEKIPKESEENNTEELNT